MREGEVRRGEEVSVDCADDGGEGLDVEEENGVDG